MLLLLSLAACDLGGTSCTEIGCINQLTLHVTYEDGSPATDANGTVTVGGTTVTFDCAAPDTGVSCSNGDVTFSFSGDGGDIDYEVHTQGFVAADQAAPVDWSTSTPNGADCPPTCYFGELDVVLLSTP